MDIKDDFFKNINYCKRGLEKALLDIKQTYEGKVFVLTDAMQKVNVISYVQNYLIESALNYLPITINFPILSDVRKLLVQKAEDCDVIICIGDQRLCEVGKWLASVSDRSLYILPLLANSFLLFKKQFFISKDIYPTTCNSLIKIYLDEDIIKMARSDEVKKSLKMLLSLKEYVISKQCCDSLFNVASAIKEHLKIFDTAKEFMLQNCIDDEAKLTTFDMIIEQAYLLKNCALDEMGFINLARLLKSDDLWQSAWTVSSDALIALYRSMFSMKKIQCLYVPDYDLISHQSKLVNQKINLKQYSYFDDIINNKQLLLKLNIIKDKMLNNIKEIENKYAIKEEGIVPIDISGTLDAMKLLPFACENNKLLDCVGAFGLTRY